MVCFQNSPSFKNRLIKEKKNTKNIQEHSPTDNGFKRLCEGSGVCLNILDCNCQ